MLTVVFAVLHDMYDEGWMLSAYVTFLTISYHFSMRLIVGEVVSVIYRNREFNLNSAGFRIHRFEKDLYRILNVKKWKVHMITAKPEQFDLRENSMDELLHNVGQAELEITCNFKGAGNILKPKKNPKIKVLECTDEELME